MELMYPIAIIICSVLIVLICFSGKKRKEYTQGKRIANTKYIKETKYYKTKLKKYIILSNLVKGLSVLCVIINSILIARPITVQNKSENKFNRDIIIGLDISTSECEVNLELIKQFKKIIPNIEGDRIGIVIYNTAPIVYCPLTNDYEYVEECLDKIKKQMNLVVKNDGNIPYTSTFDEEDLEMFTFWNGGAVANSDKKGSSLIGDGLARNVIFVS